MRETPLRAAARAGPARTDAGPCSMHSTVIVNTEWERLLSWFMSVAPTLRFFFPTCPGGEEGGREGGADHGGAARRASTASARHCPLARTALRTQQQKKSKAGCAQLPGNRRRRVAGPPPPIPAPPAHPQAHLQHVAYLGDALHDKRV